MPKSMTGFIGFVLVSVIATSISLFIINRVPMLRNVIGVAA